MYTVHMYLLHNKRQHGLAKIQNAGLDTCNKAVIKEAVSTAVYTGLAKKKWSQVVHKNGYFGFNWIMCQTIVVSLFISSVVCKTHEMITNTNVIRKWPINVTNDYNVRLFHRVIM